MIAKVQSKPLYAFYGDDFTGSTDVLESLGMHGIDAVLFTRTPTPRDLSAFSHCRAIGIAGESRSRNPAWMTLNLPSIFRALRRLGAPINHYKVCSTFDSSPRVGSIGRAIELGRSVFGTQPVPIVVGAPRLGRAVIFGNLFAEADGRFHRIDRHPTMRHHPITPMEEADLRLHLAAQTRLRIGLVECSAFQSGTVEERLRDEEKSGRQAVVFDGFSDAMLEETARIISDRAVHRPLFAVGSSGLTHGLLLHWRSAGIIRANKVPASAKPIDRTLVLSGSYSPVTVHQIRRARQSGFYVGRLGSVSSSWNGEAAKSCDALKRGQSVVLHTALGPPDKGDQHGRHLGEAMGKLLRQIVLETGVRRVLVAGGDTSTHAVKELGLDALTFVASLSPGVPLCRAHAPASPLNGLELVLKGGQMGGKDFFAQVRDGAAR